MVFKIFLYLLKYIILLQKSSILVPTELLKSKQVEFNEESG